jgi:Raf kinase inhibitor-like YbhB/YbcL family protein
MPHQNTQSSKAAGQNAATDNPAPNDQAREQNASVRAEPRTYVAPDVEDSTLAPPAAGEVADYMDEGDALGADGLQQGGNHGSRPGRTEAGRGQGPKTHEANREIVRTGSAGPVSEARPYAPPAPAKHEGPHPEHSGEAISILKVEPRSDETVVLTSPAIGTDGRIDPRCVADGENLSPPLAWDEVEGAGAYALIVEDPDAPQAHPVLHWMAWNIPGGLTELPEGLPNAAELITPQGMVQGRNVHGGHGWFGPKPPPGHGLHRYHFQMYALDGPLTISPEPHLRTLLDANKSSSTA